ncbi:MAG TPA: hypothetical protein VHA09_03945 [Nitrososphaera sp.]|nr:hypothetical protein [Nitrososphaera sp.]
MSYMWRLVKFLEENDPEALPRKELVLKLHEIWPGDNDENGLPTRDHEELASAISSALWLGRRAQQVKEKTGDRGAEQFFKEAMTVAFETGRRSAITAP